MKPKILIGVPARDDMPTATAKSLTALARAGYDIVFATGGGLPTARNGICQAVLDQGYDACLQIDSDMVFLVEHAQELVRHAGAHGRPILSGRYFSRSRPHRPQAYRGDPPAPVYGDVGHDRSETVDYTGAGFLYITAQALAGVPGPWFDHSLERGEDAFFCRKAAEHGFPTWYYPWVTLGHVGTIMYSDPQYERVLEVKA